MKTLEYVGVGAMAGGAIAVIPHRRNAAAYGELKMATKWEPWITYKDNNLPMNIPYPPCANCKYWRPQRDFADYGKTVIGVTLCTVADGDPDPEMAKEMWADFSCFRQRNESETPALIED